MKDTEFVKLKIPDGINAMRYLTEHEPKSVCVLFGELLRIMDKTNGLFAKQAELAEICHVKRLTIVRATKRLIALEFIRAHGAGHHTYYEINAGIATRCSKRVEQYSTGYELWYAKILVKK